MKEPVTILCFGAIGEITGHHKILLHDVHDTDSLVHALELQFPSLQGIKYVIAVNEKMITGTAVLETGATVALLPPYSGG